jgi:hypothetical protein
MGEEVGMRKEGEGIVYPQMGGGVGRMTVRDHAWGSIGGDSAVTQTPPSFSELQRDTFMYSI